MSDGWFIFWMLTVIASAVGVGEFLKWRIRR